MECVRNQNIILERKGLMTYILSAKRYDLRKSHILKEQKDRNEDKTVIELIALGFEYLSKWQINILYTNIFIHYRWV